MKDVEKFKELLDKYARLRIVYLQGSIIEKSETLIKIFEVEKELLRMYREG